MQSSNLFVKGQIEYEKDFGRIAKILFFVLFLRKLRWIGCVMWVIESVKKGKTSL
jgi:hypothetical protein